MLAFLVGAIGSAIGLIGWYYSGSIACLIIGVIAYIIETILEEENLTPKARQDVFVAFGIGALISVFRKVNPWYLGGMIGVNVWGGLLTIYGIIFYITLFTSKKK